MKSSCLKFLFLFILLINLSSFYAQNLPEDGTPAETEEDDDNDSEPINEDELDDEVEIEENIDELKPFDEELWDKEFKEEEDN